MLKAINPEKYSFFSNKLNKNQVNTLKSVYGISFVMQGNWHLTISCQNKLLRANNNKINPLSANNNTKVPTIPTQSCPKAPKARCSSFPLKNNPTTMNTNIGTPTSPSRNQCILNLLSSMAKESPPRNWASLPPISNSTRKQNSP